MITVNKYMQEDGITISLVNRNKKLVMMMGGNLDLYIIPYLSGSNIAEYVDFEISTKDPIIYDFFNNLYNKIINYDALDEEDMKDILIENLKFSDQHSDYPLVNGSEINWYSDDEIPENANLMKISKTKDLKIKLEFFDKQSKVIKPNGVRIRNSRSRYTPFNNRLMELYNELCNFDFSYNDIDFSKVVIGTSCYQNAKGGNIVSITGDGGNAWGFFGNAYKRLAPSYKLWQYYSNNPDNLSYEQLCNYYIMNFYNHRLDELDLKQLLATLKMRYGDDIILTCHELPSTNIDMESFCHRRLIADYLELEMGLIIPEVSTNDSGLVTQKEIYDLKPIIKSLIKK